MPEEDLELKEIKPPANKKMFILFGAMGLLLIMIVGLVTFLLIDDEEQPPEQVTKVEGTEGEGEGEDSEDGEEVTGPKNPAIYHALDPTFVANITGKRSRFLQVVVQVMARDNTAIDAVKQHDPMIRNQLLQLFSAQTTKGLRTLEGKETLRTTALAEVNKILAQEVGGNVQIEAVYFTSFVMQ